MKNTQHAKSLMLCLGLSLRMSSLSWYLTVKVLHFVLYDILRKTIEGYFDSVPSLTFNAIKTKLIMHAFYSSKYLQSKSMFDFSYASMINVQYMSKWSNPLY